MKQPTSRVRFWHGPTITRDNERYRETRRAAEKAGIVQAEVQKKIEVKMANRRTGTVVVGHKVKKA